MKVTLCTSPHLDRSPLFDGRDKHTVTGNLPMAQTFVPMGLLSLAGSVTDMDVRPQIFDINKQINSGAVPLSRELYTFSADLILSELPDVVGFMTDCNSFHHLVRICSCIKQRAPATVIVLGCVHASYNAEPILRRYPFIDYIIREEGEIAFHQLLEAIAGRRSLAAVGNLTYREGEDIHSVPSLPLIANLDTLPMPDMSLISLDSTDAVWVEIGRGCPFKCNFCVTAPYWSRRHRIKSPQRIITELRFFRDRYQRHDFNFTHDLFTTDRRWVLKFCAALTEAKMGVTWTCSSRTDTLDEEQLAAMARAGCRDIYFGVETGTSHMQSAIDKGLVLTEARQIIERCHQYGVSTTVGFIAGLPGETAATLSGTLREAASYMQMKQTVVHLFGYCPYRGSSSFAEIEDDLVPELQFVDFPLDKEAEAENRALIQSHRDVFARYSRLAVHREQGFDAILEVAEEYFPILNAIPHITAYLIEVGIEPYHQLCSWAEWLARQRQERCERTYHAHLGSIDDFLNFIDEFINSRGLGGDRFDDLMKWERLKQLFRSEAPETQLSRDDIAGNSGSQLRLNPTVQLGQFRFVPGVQQDTSERSLLSYAFLRRPDGAAGIVRVGSLARAIMKVANEKRQADGLLLALGESVRLDQTSGEADLTVNATLDQLVASGIVFLH